MKDSSNPNRLLLPKFNEHNYTTSHTDAASIYMGLGNMEPSSNWHR